MNKPVVLARSLFLALMAFSAPVMAQVGGGAIASVDEPMEAVGGGPADPRKSAPRTSRSSAGNRTAAVQKKAPAPARPAPRAWNGPIIGDKYLFLNFEVLSAEKPYHTRAAKAAGASGLVQVEILIETSGSVIAARARTGNKLLHPEAERAALASKFNRPSLDGRPARAVGFLVYRFGPAED